LVEDEVMPLGGSRAVWYRIEVPPVAAAARAVLAVRMPTIDKVELYRPDGSGGWNVQRAGDSLPVAEWPIRHLYPAFAFTVQPGEPRDATYLKVQSSHPVPIRWTLWDASSFNEANKLWHLVLGGSVGFMLLVLLLAVVHAVFWRDSIHLFFGVHVALVGMSFMSLTGLAGEYLWPRSPWWNDLAPAVLPAAALGWTSVFVRELVAERGRRWLSAVLIAQAVISAFIVIAFVQFGRGPVFLWHNLYAVPSLALLLAVLAWYALRNPAIGWWVLAGVAVLTIGSVFPLMNNLGFEPSALGLQYGLQVAAAMEIPLVMIGLYFRSRERRENRLRVQALAHTDPLTGVGSPRVLTDRLEQLLDRHRRDASLGAVLRVRVGNLAGIANEFGREAAEAAMVRTAECLAREARQGDTVAREETGDLVLLLDGRMTREQAMAAGRNIIAGGLKFSGRLPPGVTLSLQVAVACAPLPDSSVQAMLGTLGRMLQDIADDPGGRAMRVMQGTGKGESPTIYQGASPPIQ
jgi:GGDEF domain-containing protein